MRRMPAEDARLAASLLATKKLVLPCDRSIGGKWEDPLPKFSEHALALGHVYLSLSAKLMRTA